MYFKKKEKKKITETILNKKLSMKLTSHKGRSLKTAVDTGRLDGTASRADGFLF